jgi:hypothetical protein
VTIALIAIPSVISIGFGIWHFFVPSIWNWYGYIAPEATELVLAVRAINVFFSLCLVLTGAANLLAMALGALHERSFAILLGVSLILWILRVAMQIAYPQGSMLPALQFGMLGAFLFCAALYGLGFIHVLRQVPGR